MKVFFIAIWFSVVLMKIVLPASAQVTCDNSSGTSPFAICGSNGGTATQIFTPGSVIVLQRNTLTDDLISDALQFPEVSEDEVSRAAKQRALPGRSEPRFLFGDGLYGASLTVFSSDLTENAPAFDQSTGELSFGRRKLSDVEGAFFSLGIGLSQKSADETVFVFFPTTSPTEVNFGKAKERQVDFFTEASLVRNIADNTQFFASGRASIFALQTNRIVNDANSNLFDNNFTPIPTSGSTFGASFAGEAGLLQISKIGNSFLTAMHGLVRASHTYTRGFTETSDVSATLNGGTLDQDTLLPITVAPGDPSFTYASNNITQIQTEVGFSVSRPVSTSGGFLVPSFTAAWIHDFTSTNQSQTVSVSTDFDGSVSSGGTFELPFEEPDRDFFRVGVGVGAPLKNGAGFWSVEYETFLGHSYIDRHRLSANLLVQF